MKGCRSPPVFVNFIFMSDPAGNTPPEVYREALKAQQTLKKLLAEINQLLETTKRLIKDTNTGSQSLPDEGDA